MAKLSASEVRIGDKIIIPSVHARVVSIENADSIIANISDHTILVFEMNCDNGPFRGFKGKCTVVGTDKLNVIKRMTWLCRLMEWYKNKTTGVTSYPHSNETTTTPTTNDKAKT